MGCLLSTPRPREALFPNNNDRISIVKIKAEGLTDEPTSIAVPPLSPPTSTISATRNQPDISAPSAAYPEMERPPSRMEWEPTPPPQPEISSDPRPTHLVDGYTIPQLPSGNPEPRQNLPPLPPLPPVPPFAQQQQMMFARPGPQQQWNARNQQIPLPPLQFIDPRLAPAPPPQMPSIRDLEKRCMICTSTLEKSGAVYPCSRCKLPYCVDCLRYMFLAAMKDESRMPPRCCNMVHLSVARPYLSSDEISQFKAKYEEWNTPNRLYCPVPTCSTFISPRLISAATRSAATVAEHERQQKQSNDNVTVVFSTGVKMQLVDPQNPPAVKAPATPVTVECPTCFTEICTTCKEYAHSPLPCLPETDLLGDMLKKWKIKRCPKCRAAVRRMYGCPHIRCRCGAQWCWFCLGPIDECRDAGCPEQDAADREDAGYDTEEDDEEDDVEDDCEDNAVADRERERLERRQRRATDLGDLDAAIDRQENLNLGEEPNADEVDPWNCDHTWRKRGDSKDHLPRKLECHHCWTDVTYDIDMDVDFNLNRLFDPVKAAAEENEAAKAGPSKSANDTSSKPGVECSHCGVVYCNECKEEVEKENKLRWEDFDARVRAHDEGL